MECFVVHFPELLSSFATPYKMEQLQEEFITYQLLKHTDKGNMG